MDVKVGLKVSVFENIVLRSKMEPRERQQEPGQNYITKSFIIFYPEANKMWVRSTYKWHENSTPVGKQRII
jgi:hypothetical protein